MQLPRPQQIQILSLDGFRGILCLWVYFLHIAAGKAQNSFAYPFPALFNFLRGGFMAVEGFFALSGFIMTHVYKKQFETCFSNNFENFWGLYFKFLFYRFGRLWPLHFVVSSISFLAMSSCSCGNYLGEVFMLSPLLGNYCNIVCWSMIIEFYAYFFFPMLLYIGFRLNKENLIVRNLVFPFIFYFLMILFDVGYDAVLGKEVGLRINLVYGTIKMTVVQFYFGVCQYNLYEKNKGKHWFFDVLLFFICLSIFYLSSHFDYLSHYPYFTILILIAPYFLARMDSIVFYLLNSKMLKFMGEISYSFYLGHITIHMFIVHHVIIIYFLINISFVKR